MLIDVVEETVDLEEIDTEYVKMLKEFIEENREALEELAQPKSTKKFIPPVKNTAAGKMCQRQVVCTNHPSVAADVGWSPDVIVHQG